MHIARHSRQHNRPHAPRQIVPSGGMRDAQEEFSRLQLVSIAGHFGSGAVV